MKERILRFLQVENKTSSQFAEEIGVQPSSISHIISGRNNPSLDFILKMLGKYGNINPDWLLFGNGQMYRDSTAGDNIIVNDPVVENVRINQPGLFDVTENKVIENNSQEPAPISRNGGHSAGDSIKRSTAKIILLYDDNSFEEYDPS